MFPTGTPTHEILSALFHTTLARTNLNPPSSLKGDARNAARIALSKAIRSDHGNAVAESLHMQALIAAHIDAQFFPSDEGEAQ